MCVEGSFLQSQYYEGNVMCMRQQSHLHPESQKARNIILYSVPQNNKRLGGGTIQLIQLIVLLTFESCWGSNKQPVGTHHVIKLHETLIMHRPHKTKRRKPQLELHSRWLNHKSRCKRSTQTAGLWQKKVTSSDARKATTSSCTTGGANDQTHLAAASAFCRAHEPDETPHNATFDGSST